MPLEFYYPFIINEMDMIAMSQQGQASVVI